MNIQKHFEVKTGKNKGCYIVTKIKRLDEKTYKRMAETWGILAYEYNSGFYTYHHVNPFTELIWTGSAYMGYVWNKAIFYKLLQESGCNYKLYIKV